jgi:MFS transporter, DHA1 family, putative efflux transporter
VTTIRGVWWFGSLTYLGAFLGTAVGLGERQLGLVYSLAGGAYVVGSAIAGGRRGTFSPRTVVVAATVAAGVLFGVALIDSSLWVVLPALLVANVTSAQCGIGVMALLAAESPAQAGTTMILNNSVLSLGMAVGAVLGGSLIAVAGYSALGVGVALLALIGAILAWWPAPP